MKANSGQRQDAGAVVHAGTVHPRNRRHGRHAAGVDEDASGTDLPLALFTGIAHGTGDAHRLRIDEAGTGVDHAHLLHVVQFGEVGGAQFGDQAVLGLHGGAEHGIATVGAGRAALAFRQQFLGRDAADVDAGAAIHLVGSLDQDHVLAVLGQIGRQRLAGLAKADDQVLGGECLHDEPGKNPKKRRRGVTG